MLQWKDFNYYKWDIYLFFDISEIDNKGLMPREVHLGLGKLKSPVGPINTI